MNILQKRLQNTQHMMLVRAGGAGIVREGTYNVGEQFAVNQDVDIQVENAVVSIPEGTVGRVHSVENDVVVMDMGESAGKFMVPVGEMNKYFKKHKAKTESVNKLSESTARKIASKHGWKHDYTGGGPHAYHVYTHPDHPGHELVMMHTSPNFSFNIEKGGDILHSDVASTHKELADKLDKHLPTMKSTKTESVRMNEANPTTSTPGRLVQITAYDPSIGPNRGPKSPGQGGYQTLVGQRGMINTLFGEINGIKTYKVQLTSGGEFVFGETEFQVLESEDKSKKLNLRALHGLGLGL